MIVVAYNTNENRVELLPDNGDLFTVDEEIPTQSCADVTKVKLPTLVAVHTKDGLVTEIVQTRHARMPHWMLFFKISVK